MKCVVTGAAGFIGSHLCGIWPTATVTGIGCFTDYYPRLKSSCLLFAASRATFAANSISRSASHPKWS